MFKALSESLDRYVRNTLKEETEVFHNTNGNDYTIIERSEDGKNCLLRDDKGNQWIIAWNCPKDNRGSWGQGHYYFDKEAAEQDWEDYYKGGIPKDEEETDVEVNDEVEEPEVNDDWLVDDEEITNEIRRDESLKEYINPIEFMDAEEAFGNVKPGDIFRNRAGATIEIIEPTKDGRIQYNIYSKGRKDSKDCRSTTEKSIKHILYDNNYVKVNESLSETNKTDSKLVGLNKARNKSNNMDKKMSDLNKVHKKATDKKPYDEFDNLYGRGFDDGDNGSGSGGSSGSAKAYKESVIRKKRRNLKEEKNYDSWSHSRHSINETGKIKVNKAIVFSDINYLVDPDDGDKFGTIEDALDYFDNVLYVNNNKFIIKPGVYDYQKENNDELSIVLKDGTPIPLDNLLDLEGKYFTFLKKEESLMRNRRKSLKEAYFKIDKDPIRFSENIADSLEEFLDWASRTEDIGGWFGEDDLKLVGEVHDMIFDFAEFYSTRHPEYGYQ